MLSEIERFESLGDNCEFGFVLRMLGNTKSTLFRWAYIADYGKLLEFVSCPVSDIYNKDLLIPFVDDMVTNTKYNISFHSKLKSKLLNDVNRCFIISNDEFLRIHKDESEKMVYLLDRFRASLNDREKIFVCKTNDNSMADEISHLAKKLFQNSGSAVLRVVISENESMWGKVEKVSPSLYLGYIDKFATYEKADEIRSMFWPSIISNALKVI